MTINYQIIYILHNDLDRSYEFKVDILCSAVPKSFSPQVFKHCIVIYPAKYDDTSCNWYDV